MEDTTMKKTYIQPEMLQYVLTGELLTGASIKRDGTNAKVDVTDDTYDDVFCSRRHSVWDDEEEDEEMQ